MSLEKLIEKLKELDLNIESMEFAEGEDSDSPKYLNDSSDNFRENASEQLKELVSEVLTLADGELITNEGNPNFDNHRILATNGFEVTCGERDSWGWLTGVIHLKQFRLVYG